MDNPSQLSRRVYRVNSELRGIYIITFIILITLMILQVWIMFIKTLSPFMIVLNILVLVIAILGLFVGSLHLRDRLEVSYEGVTYCGSGFCIYTPWNNIARMTRISYPTLFFFRRPLNSFVLKSPALLNVPIEEGKVQKMAVIEKRWPIFFIKLNIYNTCLPLSLLPNLNKENLSQHELEAYIIRYAPDTEIS